ncbi:hypothetical protein PSQ90_06905 [Devosia rhodophyticola]|uniref:ABC transmembrane type-1 domain-containing protein n=1 Tax=Devosia rhodophyticola TaxID=3026423 RepID=A0ABY7Z181_9HYPH|nr:hypothetical protein [Devosia rhodophyticola]WDR07152.1 hypothetical protein PSQ90_06905 [Devosia rhodophyticola]
MTATAHVTGLKRAKSRNLWRDAARRFVRNKLAIVGMVVVVVFLVLAILGSAITPYDPFDQDLIAALQGPSAAHWLGTDDLGRDVLSRLIIGARTALFVAIVTISISLVIGIVLGTMAGYLGPWADTLIMWFSDVVQSIPPYCWP